LQRDLSEAEFLSVTTDAWSSKNFIGFLGVTAHFINAEFQMVSRTIDISQIHGSHTGINICEALLSVFEKWEIKEKG
jgi:hypothetical protein